MNKSKIEWCDYTWNPVHGCQNTCSYCYARVFANRIYVEKFRPVIDHTRLPEPYYKKKPLKIFTVSMGELFGPWVPDSWIKDVIKITRMTPRHTFIFLTKYPERYKHFDFPCNAWLGTTVDTQKAAHRIEVMQELKQTHHPEVVFISFEPLLEQVIFDSLKNIDWIIIGAQTNPTILPDLKWTDYLILKSRQYETPVFLKNNLNLKEHLQQYPRKDES